MKQMCQCFSEFRNLRKQIQTVYATAPTTLSMAGIANQSSPENLDMASESFATKYLGGYACWMRLAGKRAFWAIPGS